MFLSSAPFAGLQKALVSLRKAWRLAPATLAGLASVCLLASPAFSQYSSDQVANQYLQLVVGQSGTVGSAGPSGNKSVDVSGRWTIGTTGGDINAPATKNIAIISGYPDPWGAYTIIKVDKTASVVYGDQNSGAWLVVPSGDSTTNTTTSSYQLTAAPIVISRTMKIVRDVVRVEYDITNNDTVSHQIGIATSMDAEYGLKTGLPVTGGPFYSLLTGTINTESQLSGTDVPDVMYGLDNLPNYAVVTQTIMRGQDATPPDKVVTAEAVRSFGDFWAFQPISGKSILTDSALLLYWNQQVVSSGGQRSPIVFYFGLGQSVENYGFPGVLALETPFSLAYTRASGQQTGSITPSPFTVEGYLYNLNTQIPLSNVQVQLTLDPGLTFAPGQQATQTIGSIPAGKEGTATWQVQADGTGFGPLAATLSVAGFPLTAKSVTRTINVPATEQQTFSGQTWQMVSVPFQATNPDPATTFGLTPGTFQAWSYDPVSLSYIAVPSLQPGMGFWFRPATTVPVQLQNVAPVANSTTAPLLLNLPAGWNQIGDPFIYGLLWGRFQVLQDPTLGPVSLSNAISRNWIRGTLYWYDLITGQYDFSSSPTTVVTPWTGYWLKVLQPVTLIFPPVDIMGGGVTVGSATAPVAGAAPPVADATLPVSGATPVADALRSTASPGYTKEDAGSPAAVRSLSSAGAGGTSWSVRLEAVGQESEDTNNFFGEDSNALDGYDPMDVEKLFPSGSVKLWFEHQDWGVNAGSYATDYRSPGRYRLWALKVESTGAAQTIRLVWPGVETLPKGTTLRLIDDSARTTMSMGPGQSYRFRAQAGRVRVFHIVAAMRGGWAE